MNSRSRVEVPGRRPGHWVTSDSPKRLSGASDDPHIPDAEIAPAWMPAQCQNLPWVTTRVRGTYVERNPGPTPDGAASPRSELIPSEAVLGSHLSCSRMVLLSIGRSRHRLSGS